MSKKYKPADGVDIKEFQENLKNNNGTCICSLDYDNPDMKCMCKEYKENAEVGEICHCGIFIRVE